MRGRQATRTKPDSAFLWIVIAPTRSAGFFAPPSRTRFATRPHIGSSITPTHMESERISGAWTCLRDSRESIASFPARCPRYRSRSQSIPTSCRAKCTKIPPCFESARTPPTRCRIESWPPWVSLPPPTRRYSSISAQLLSLQRRRPSASSSNGSKGVGFPIPFQGGGGADLRAVVRGEGGGVAEVLPHNDWHDPGNGAATARHVAERRLDRVSPDRHGSRSNALCHGRSALERRPDPVFR